MKSHSTHYITFKTGFFSSKKISWLAKNIYIILQIYFTQSEPFELSDIAEQLCQSEEAIQEGINELIVNKIATYNSEEDKYYLVDPISMKIIKLAVAKGAKIAVAYKPTEKGAKFAKWFGTHYYDSSQPLTDSVINGWAKAYEQIKTKCLDISDNNISDVIRWAKQDDFWKDKFYSPTKLMTKTKDGRLFIYYFLDKMKESKDA